MDKNRWRLGLGAGLILASAALYFVHYLIFHDAHHIFVYLMGDIAFVPIEVLLVTLILHELLSLRERRALLQKLNMTTGLFFTVMGTQLLAQLLRFAPNAAELSQRLRGMKDWGKADYKQRRAECARLDAKPDCTRGDLGRVAALLSAHRGFLLDLLGNPNLLEHEAFTDLLWAVMHLSEELSNRPDFEDLPRSDLDHLAGDVNRALGLLLREWLAYMQHLSEEYPYLFSLALRTLPWDPEADPVVQ